MHQMFGFGLDYLKPRAFFVYFIFFCFYFFFLISAGSEVALPVHHIHRSKCMQSTEMYKKQNIRK